MPPKTLAQSSGTIGVREVLIIEWPGWGANSWELLSSRDRPFNWAAWKHKCFLAEGRQETR